MSIVPFGARISQIAAARPDDLAIMVVGPDGDGPSLTWRELDTRTNQVARALAGLGVTADSFVGISFPNGLEHYLAAIGTWKLGACAMPVRPVVPDRERQALLEVRTPTVMLGGWAAPCPVLNADQLRAAADTQSADPLPPIVPQPGRATTSGGSTGTPKLIVDVRPFAWEPGEYAGAKSSRIGLGYGQRQLVAGSLYHTVGFFFSNRGLFEEHTLFVMSHFDPATALAAIERHRIQFTVLVPTMMLRMMRDPACSAADLSSLEALLHSGASCPPHVKRFWIDRIGPSHVFESYGSTESAGSATNRGDEWLKHPGTAGRSSPGSEIQILDDDGKRCPPGMVGEIFFRTTAPLAFEYQGGHQPTRAADGSVSIGDLGYLDDEGYLFIVDRRTDMIVSGGANVYTSEVESALLEHPAIDDAVVIGLPDKEWGRRVHAVVVAGDRSLTEAEVIAHCRDRLAAPKVPKSVEWTDALPRDHIGKIRRSLLVAARTPEAEPK
jgi:bile acid-coenzyme A ligase